MSIFGSNEIRNYFLAEGMNAAFATALQTSILSMESSGSFTAKDAEMIRAISAGFKYLMDTINESLQGSEYNEDRYAWYANLTMAEKCMRHFVVAPGMLEFVGERCSAETQVWGG